VDPELIVTVPPESLFRGLSNVVRNAIRYAGHCGPIVLAAERRGESILVTVTDRGPGIPEESLEMVFTPFYRLDISRARETGGNGLGMAICRTCIEGCNGTVYCRNVNPGLQVTVTLPVTT
jgi:two-component system sensor histidine kinase CpxA